MTDRANELALRGADLRVTRPRLAVMAALERRPHAETSAIIELVRERHADVSHQAVYDVLAALTSAGLVRRIQPLGSVARYEVRVGDNHHHVVCRRCGSVADVDCAVGEAPCLDPLVDHDYVIDEAEVIYWGVCPDCQEPARPARAGRAGAVSTKPRTREESRVRRGR